MTSLVTSGMYLGSAAAMLVLPSLAHLAGPAFLLKVAGSQMLTVSGPGCIADILGAAGEHIIRECSGMQLCIILAAQHHLTWQTMYTQIVGGMGFAWLGLWMTIGKEIPHR
jgi:hypothetical protein